MIIIYCAVLSDSKRLVYVQVGVGSLLKIKIRLFDWWLHVSRRFYETPKLIFGFYERVQTIYGPHFLNIFFRDYACFLFARHFVYFKVRRTQLQIGQKQLYIRLGLGLRLGQDAFRLGNLRKGTDLGVPSLAELGNNRLFVHFFRHIWNNCIFVLGASKHLGFDTLNIANFIIRKGNSGLFSFDIRVGFFLKRRREIVIGRGVVILLGDQVSLGPKESGLPRGPLRSGGRLAQPLPRNAFSGLPRSLRFRRIMVLGHLVFINHGIVSERWNVESLRRHGQGQRTVSEGTGISLSKFGNSGRRIRFLPFWYNWE